jgi:hypothetical protein
MTSPRSKAKSISTSEPRPLDTPPPCSSTAQQSHRACRSWRLLGSFPHYFNFPTARPSRIGPLHPFSSPPVRAISRFCSVPSQLANAPRRGAPERRREVNASGNRASAQPSDSTAAAGQCCWD